MEKIKSISNEKIEESLLNNNRQYLIGNLSLHQDLSHIHDENVEVGMSDYKEFTADEPHTHRNLTEYQVMLSGYSEIMDIDTGNVTKLNEGDFFMVLKGTRYAQKSSQGTRILFFKYPGGNDKELVNVSDEVLCWLNEEI